MFGLELAVWNSEVGFMEKSERDRVAAKKRRDSIEGRTNSQMVSKSWRC